jgi:hypothetical protein
MLQTSASQKIVPGPAVRANQLRLRTEAYPEDLRTLPLLLEQVRQLSAQLEGIAEAALDLSHEVDKAVVFLNTRVAVNRAREARRLPRNQATNHNSNGNGARQKE